MILETEKYVPVTYSDRQTKAEYTLILVPTKACGVCKKTMFDVNLIDIPGVDDQRLRAGMQINSRKTGALGFEVCAMCAITNKISFICALCNEERRSEMEARAFGTTDPEFLCKACYDTVPARQWDEAVARLTQRNL